MVMEEANAAEVRARHAENIYNALVRICDEREWHYTRHDEQKMLDFMLTGDDLVMRFFIMVDEERQLVRISSPMMFRPNRNNSLNICLATTVINYLLQDGNFEYDPKNNTLQFRMTASILHGNFGIGLFNYLIDCACTTVDRYNDKLFAVSLGYLGLDDILKDEFARGSSDNS